MHQNVYIFCNVLSSYTSVCIPLKQRNVRKSSVFALFGKTLTGGVLLDEPVLDCFTGVEEGV